MPRRKKQDDDPTDDQPGIECPKCGCRDLFVIYTRPVMGSKLRRRRECRYCRNQFLTLEIIQS